MKDTAEIGDGSLAQAAAAGDLAAFEALVRRYQHLLYRDALGYLGSHDEALDAVQEALIGALSASINCASRSKLAIGCARRCGVAVSICCAPTGVESRRTPATETP